MKTFVINLKEATERREHMARQLDDLGLNYEFFDACRSAEGYQPYFTGYDPDVYMLISRRTALPGEIGCYASHLSLWQRCIEIDEPIVILEDDSFLEPSLPNAVTTAEKIIDTCGFIRLEANKQSRQFFKPSRYQRIGSLDNYQISYLSRIAVCATGYVISPAAAKNLVENSTTLLGPVDKYIQRTWHHKQPLYLLSPAPVIAQTGEIDSHIKHDGTSKKHALGIMLFLKIALFKTTNYFRRVYFNATVGKQSRTEVQQLLRALS
jgi:glycosyl transferase family 25